MMVGSSSSTGRSARISEIPSRISCDAILDGIEDLTLHTFRGCAQVREHHADDGKLHVGQLIGFRLPQRERAESCYGEHRRDRDDRPLDGEIGDEHDPGLSGRWE